MVIPWHWDCNRFSRIGPLSRFRRNRLAVDGQTLAAGADMDGFAFADRSVQQKHGQGVL